MHLRILRILYTFGIRKYYLKWHSLHLVMLQLSLMHCQYSPLAPAQHGY